MSFGEGISEGAGVEKILLHCNGNANDSSGNGYNGTATNVTYGLAYGKFNEGGLFNSTSPSKISIADNNDLHFVNNFTVSCWAYYTTSTTQWAFISKHEVIGGSYKGFGLSRESNGKIRMVTYNGGTSFTVTYSKLSGTSYNNRWLFIVGVVSSNNVILYINGELQNTTAGANMQYVTSPLLIGAANYAGNSDYYSGYIDEIRVRTRVLTLQEIQKEYTNALGRF